MTKRSLTLGLDQRVGAVVETGRAGLLGHAGGDQGEDSEEDGGELHLD